MQLVYIKYMYNNIFVILLYITMLNELIVSGIIMLILDFGFIGINQTAFATQVASIQRVAMQVKPIGAILCYILLIFGLYYFILRTKRSVLDAFLLGIVIYGVYDTTGYTIFKKWDPYLAIMDTLWGGILLALTTYLTYRILN